MVLSRGQVRSGLTLSRCAAFVAVLGLALTLILGFRLLPVRYSFKEGEVAAQTVKAPVRIGYTSQIRTQEKRAQAASLVNAVLVYNAGVSEQQLQRLSELDGKVVQLSKMPGFALEEKRRTIREIKVLSLSPQAIDAILGLSVDQWQTVTTEVVRLLSSSYESRVTAEQIPSARQRAISRMDTRLGPNQALAVSELVQTLLQPNLVVDEQETEKARREAMVSVEPVQVVVEKGETIVRDGEIVRALEQEKLGAAGLLQPHFQWQEIIGVALLSLVLSVALGLYLFVVQPSAVMSDRRLLLLLVVIVGAVLAARLIIPGRAMYAYVFPLAAAPMLIVTLLDLNMALLVTAVLGVLVGYVAGFMPESVAVGNVGPLESLGHVAVYFAGGLAGLVLAWRAERLTRFFIAGAGVSLVAFGILLALWLLTPGREMGTVVWYAVVSLGNGALSSALAVGAFILLGTVFGISTSFHLLELAQPNQPLLRRLQVEAPGTYHHSIIVANLAERAADVIGADSLLARVGSYYHDTGKVLRPGFFVENQLGGENIHSTLDPTTSAAIIISHVTEGVSLARKYRLPSKICDFIAEHHGTRLASFFYTNALQEREEVDPRPFTYPGPRPQSRESGIVMLADSVEAVVRASRDRSQEAIDKLIDKIINERLAEGQLDDCDLTLRDLYLIREAFKGVLKGVYHPRIEYPDAAAPKRVEMPFIRMIRRGEEHRRNGPDSPSKGRRLGRRLRGPF